MSSETRASRLRTALEAATNVAVVVVAIVLLALLARDYLAARPDTRSVKIGLQAGDDWTSVVRSGPSENEITLVIAMSPSCEHCKESVPFFSRLTSEARRSHTARTVAAFSESEAEADLFVRDHGLEVDSVISTDLAAAGVAATPTLILLDGQGRVASFWVGQLSEERQREILAFVANATSMRSAG